MSGIGAGIAALNIGAKLSGINGALKGVPRWVWIALAAVALLAGGYLWHQHAAHKALAAAYAQGKADEAARIAKQAAEIKEKADRLNAKIATEIRSKNNETNRAIARDADALRLQGPGRAICVGHPGIPAAASGSVAPGQSADAAGPFMPPEDRAAVPWGWLVDRAEEHDLERAEVLAWREWYDRMVKAWPKP